ncbi:MAG: RluA family pseudouridine synthase [Pseudobdellovibrionaceae bacterium]
MISIIEKNSSWIVVEKPEGMSVHNQEEGGDLLKHLSSQLKTSTQDLHPVHRLDKETSGLMIVALNATAAKDLHQIFEDKKVKKVYCAVLRGVFEKDEKWSWPISDKSEGRKKPQGISADRKEALTAVRILRKSSYLTLAECEIFTGRQHQIRKHAVLAKHAILGDKRYGDDKYNTMIVTRYGLQRMALHAQKLSFDFQGVAYSFESPMPMELEELFSEKM